MKLPSKEACDTAARYLEGEAERLREAQTKLISDVAKDATGAVIWEFLSAIDHLRSLHTSSCGRAAATLERVRTWTETTPHGTAAAEVIAILQDEQ